LPSPVEDTLEPSYSSLLQDGNWNMGDMSDASHNPELFEKLEDIEDKIDTVRKSMVSMKCLCSDIKDDNIKPYRCGEVSNNMVWGDELTWTDMGAKDTDVRYPIKCSNDNEYRDINESLNDKELFYNCTSQEWETRELGSRNNPFTPFDFKSTVVTCDPPDQAIPVVQGTPGLAIPVAEEIPVVEAIPVAGGETYVGGDPMGAPQQGYKTLKYNYSPVYGGFERNEGFLDAEAQTDSIRKEIREDLKDVYSGPIGVQLEGDDNTTITLKVKANNVPAVQDTLRHNANFQEIILNKDILARDITNKVNELNTQLIAGIPIFGDTWWVIQITYWIVILMAMGVRYTISANMSGRIWFSKGIALTMVVPALFWGQYYAMYNLDNYEEWVMGFISYGVTGLILLYFYMESKHDDGDIIKRILGPIFDRINPLL
jgi:hypothetical protein